MKNIENELKLCLSKEQFDLLRSDSEAVCQVNYYFVISEEKVVRIREKNGKYTLTSKSGRTFSEGVFNAEEDSTSLTQQQATQMFVDGVEVDGLRCHLIGSMTTNRYNVKLNELQVELDESYYLDCVDYELECESDDNAQFIQLKNYLASLNIELKYNTPKSDRFSNRLSQLKQVNQATTLLWDLDGTLSNTEEGIIKTFDIVFAKYPCDNVHNVRKFIGPPLGESFAQIYNNKAVREEALAYFRELYDAEYLFLNKLYDGIRNTLLQLGKQYKMYVCTSKYEPSAFEVLERLGIKDCFNGIYGSRYEIGLTQKADIIAKMLEETGTSRNECFMIGDTLYDMRGAVANEVKAIGVLYGFGSRDELTQYNPYAIVNVATELISLLDKGIEL